MHNILINGLQLSETNTGVQSYTKYLYEEIQKFNPESFNIALATTDEFSYVKNHNRITRIFTENFILPLHFKKRKFDVYHSPNYVLPVFSPSPSVVTIHDLITLDHPHLCQTESVYYFKLLLRRSIKQATKIIAVSKTVKNDIIRHFNVPDTKIKVIWHGINPMYKKTIDKKILIKYNIPEKYILFIGNIEPKKNLVRVIHAFNSLLKTKKIYFKLVIAGKNGWKYKSVYETIQKHQLQDNIIFTGYVPDKDMPALYSMADVFIFPSIYEGFGIPPLEAMACETPVLASNTGALPETTGGNCLMVDPYNVDEIAKGMFRLISDEKLRMNCIEKGKKWAKQFTWQKTAQITLEVYREVKF